MSYVKMYEALADKLVDAELRIDELQERLRDLAKGHQSDARVWQMAYAKQISEYNQLGRQYKKSEATNRKMRDVLREVLDAYGQGTHTADQVYRMLKKVMK